MKNIVAKGEVSMKRVVFVFLFASLVIIGFLALGSMAYADDSDYTYSIIDGTNVAITGYDGTDTDLIIPETLDGYTVKEIGDFAFDSKQSLTSVTMPSGLTYIGQFAFRFCYNLQLVDMENSSLQEIDMCAFLTCRSLESVLLPDSLTILGLSAFLNCGSLQEIFIPATVTSIASFCFDDCPKLTVYCYTDSEAQYACELCSWEYVLIDSDTAQISISGPTVLYTPNGAKARYVISAKHMPPVSVIELEVSVDTKYFSFSDATAMGDFTFINSGNLYTPIYWQIGFNKIIGKVLLINSTPGTINRNTDILELIFDVKNGVIGETEFKLENIILAYGSVGAVKYEIVNDVVKTSILYNYSPYDLNRDKTVDIFDLAIALQYLTASEVDAIWEEAKIADLNADAVIDINDLVLILANYTIPFYK